MHVIEWIRRDHGVAPDAILVCSAFVLLRLPVALGAPYAWPLRLLVLMPFVLSIARNAVRIARGSVARVDGTLMLLLACYVGVVSVSYLRAVVALRVPVAVTLDGWQVFLVLAIASVLAFVAAPTSEQQEGLRLAILGGLVAYLGVNIVLYIAGVRHSEVLYNKEFPAFMLELLGIRVSAALFPMAGGVNSFGAVGGAGVAMSGAILVRRTGGGGPILLAASGMILGLVTLAWTDARLSLVFSALTVGLIAVAGNRRAGALRWVVIVPALFPAVFLGSLSIIPPAWWKAMGDGARALASLSNREGIWHAVLAKLLAFKPEDLVGYGAYGQQTSGISQAYLHYFSAYVYPEVASTHNAFLQVVMETGYLGAAIALAVMATTLGRLTRSRGLGLSRAGVRGLLGLLVFAALVGCVEASWSPEQQGIQVTLLLALCGAAVSGSEGGDGAPAGQVTQSTGGV